MQDYQIVSKNKNKTYFFIFFFCLLIFTLIYAVSYSFSPEEAYLYGFFAFLLALGGSFFTYYYSDSILLKMANAHPVVKEEEPYLYHTVEGVAIAADLPTPKAYIIETDVPNAFATGRNPEHSAVAVTRGLLKLMNREELEGVIAHEFAHIKNYDILYSSIAIVLAGTLVYLASIIRRTMFYGGGQRNRNNEKKNPVIMLIGLITIIFAPILAQLLQMAMSRSREYLADATAARTLGYPMGLASALEKLANYQNPVQANEEGFANEATAGLFIVNPLVKNLNIDSAFSTHPPIEKRINTLKNM